MRVANIIEESRFGGPQKRIALIAEELIQYNIKTIVISPISGSSEFASKLKELSLEYYFLNIKTIGKSIEKLAKYFFFFYMIFLQL